MMKVYSKVDPSKLLHIVYHLDDVVNRADLIDENNFLQCSVIREKEGKKFRPHKHISKSVTFTESNAQESWLVFRGKILVHHFDVDDALISSVELMAGDINITLSGGHTLEILEDNTIICEHKNGPYLGQALDKQFIKT